MQLEDALKTRRSVRAFRSDPVPREIIEEILDLARQSPSGTNIQPWHMHVVTGAKREELCRAVLEHRESVPEDIGKIEFRHVGGYVEPYRSRSRELGKAMYGLIGIPKGDKARMWEQWGRNYLFFDAPVGLIFTIDKQLGYNSWLDIGMLMQSIMLLAKARGLDTCPQGAWHQFYTTTKQVLGIPEDHFVACGMALGYADPDDPVNELVSTRLPVEDWAHWHGFDE